jgi:hypothetical protein
MDKRSTLDNMFTQTRLNKTDNGETLNKMSLRMKKPDYSTKNFTSLQHCGSLSSPSKTTQVKYITPRVMDTL